MDIKRSRRILVVGAPGCGALDIIRDLTGSTPLADESGSTAGLAHEWNVETAYYKAKVPIWVDEIDNVEAWRGEFSKAEAKEVVEAVGAWIYCFRQSADLSVDKIKQDTMHAIHSVTEQHAGYGADIVTLAVAMPNEAKLSKAKDGATSRDDWEDACMDFGFEYIDYAADGVNDFGEKQGFGRLKEALEANEWADTQSDEDDLDLDDLDFDATDDFDGYGREEAEMTAELYGMKAALNGHDGEGFDPEAEEIVPSSQQADQVENLDLLMSKLLAIKEQSADLPDAQRKKMAAQAVRRLMEDNPDV